MARVLYDYACANPECKTPVFEEFGDWNTPEIPVKCPSCAELTDKRLIGATRIDPRLGLDRDCFPTMADKWEKTRRQRMQIESKQAASRGE